MKKRWKGEGRKWGSEGRRRTECMPVPLGFVLENTNHLPSGPHWTEKPEYHPSYATQLNRIRPPCRRFTRNIFIQGDHPRGRVLVESHWRCVGDLLSGLTRWVSLRSTAKSYGYWTCGRGYMVLNFGSRVDVLGSERVLRDPLHASRLLRDPSPHAQRSCRSSCVLGSKMNSSLGAVGLLFWWKGRGLMPIGSRVESRVQPQCLECIISPSPSRKIPHLTTSHSPCGRGRCTGFTLQEDQGIAR